MKWEGKKNKKRACAWFQHGGQCPLFIQTAALVFKETDGILFCAWGTIVLKQTSCTRVDTYLGGCGTAGVLQMWGCATRHGSRHHLMSPDQRRRQPDSPKVVPSAFHHRCPPASQGQRSLHTSLHTTTSKEQVARLLIPFGPSPPFSWWEESVLPRDKTTGWRAGVGSGANCWKCPCLG